MPSPCSSSALAAVPPGLLRTGIVALFGIQHTRNLSGVAQGQPVLAALWLLPVSLFSGSAVVKPPARQIAGGPAPLADRVGWLGPRLPDPPPTSSNPVPTRHQTSSSTVRIAGRAPGRYGFRLLPLLGLVPLRVCRAHARLLPPDPPVACRRHRTISGR